LSANNRDWKKAKYIQIKMINKKMFYSKKGVASLSQILILIIGIVAVSYAIGSEVGEVSGITFCAYNNKEGFCTIQGRCDGTFVPPSQGPPYTCPDFDKGTKYKEETNGVWVKSNDGTGTDGNEIRCCVPKNNQQQNSENQNDLQQKTQGPSLSGTVLPMTAPTLLSKYVFNSKTGTLVAKEGAEVSAGTLPPPPTTTRFFNTLIHSNLFWAAIITTSLWAIFKFGFKEDEKANAIAIAGGIGTGVGTIVKLLGGSGTLAWGLGIGAALIYLATWKDKKIELVQFTCYPWEAPTGGKNCEECNKQNLPCSEYQCRSLGQACQLVNPGTDEEKCVWKDRNDVQYPIIQPWQDALTKGFSYSPDSTISPPDRGVRIIQVGKTNGCIPAFTPLSFGITTNEVTSCKIDYINKNSFENMSFYFGGSNTLRYNHTQTMSLPGGDILKTENLTLENDNEYELSVRCQDANGNSNPANFIFKFCVDEGPDTTAPLIVTTNLLNGMPIAYNQTSVDLNLYINEPSECKWSHTDRDYKDMESNMSCSSSVTEMNAQMLYTCKTTLTGLKDRFENKFYFRCKDQPKQSEEKRNTNSESYEFTLIGTQPLVIDSVGPNETVKDSTDSVRAVLTAHTSAGYKDGEAICYFSETGNEGDYIQFLETQSYIHTQDLFLKEGTYTYYIKCVDLGGNTDIKTTNFSVESDNAPPIVVRAYHEENYLKLITNENGECVYDTIDCSYNFDDGTKMTSLETKHFTGWSTESTLYIKCRDSYGNQPAPNECSIIVRPVE